VAVRIFNPYWQGRLLKMWHQRVMSTQLIDHLIEKRSREPQQTLCAVLSLMITQRLRRHRGSAVAQFIWIMGEIARRETNRVGWISKKLLEKAD